VGAPAVNHVQLLSCRVLLFAMKAYNHVLPVFLDLPRRGFVSQLLLGFIILSLIQVLHTFATQAHSLWVVLLLANSVRRGHIRRVLELLLVKFAPQATLRMRGTVIVLNVLQGLIQLQEFVLPARLVQQVAMEQAVAMLFQRECIQQNMMDANTANFQFHLGPLIAMLI